MTAAHLLLHEPGPSNGPTADTVFGGAPSVGEGFVWPTCATCSGNMRFLGQIRHPAADRLVLLFMCENDGGMCEEWDADAGGNAAIAGATHALHLADVPAEGAVVRPRYGIRIEQVEAENYDKARSLWGKQHPGRQRAVLGQLGGTPSWLQADETPTCTACNRPMTLLAQLETGPDYATEMNFGGGCGYLFDCDCTAAVPKFLWQC